MAPRHDSRIPVHPLRRLLQTRRRGRPCGPLGRGLGPSGRHGRDVRPEHHLRTASHQGRQALLRQALRRPPHDTGPGEVHRRLRRRGMRFDHRPRGGRRGHKGRRQAHLRPWAGRGDIHQPRDPLREDRAVPPRCGHRPRHDRPSRVRGPVVHRGLRSQDLHGQAVGRGPQPRAARLRGRRHQRRHRAHLRRGGRGRARGRILPLQEGGHGAHHRGVARHEGEARWE